MASRLHPTVRSLGLVSLFTDVSSEMIFPLLPAFLTGVLRAGPAFLGIVEGAAETAAAVLKIVSGRASDRSRRRKPLVVAGYSLSSLVRPLVALASAPWHVLAIRLADRVGKGVRGAPRDALVAQVTPAAERGRAYGFHRAMDHAGATLGPLLASAVLVFTDDLRLVFALAALPAAVAVATVAFRVHEDQRPLPTDPSGARASAEPLSPAPPLGGNAPDEGGRKTSGFSRYLLVLSLFTLGNSSDAFLLLRAQQAGVALAFVPLVWSLHNLVKATASTSGGILSDRIGRRRTIVLGWGVYALAYSGFALARSASAVVALFAFYGLFHALSEGPERALVADLSADRTRGRAFGLYHAVTGAALLPASILTGVVWQRLGGPAALAIGAGLAALAAVGLLALVPEPGAARAPARP